MHFSVYVIIGKQGDIYSQVAKALAPYHESLGPFGELDGRSGEYDWYIIGGRYDGYLHGKRKDVPWNPYRATENTISSDELVRLGDDFVYRIPDYLITQDGDWKDPPDGFLLTDKPSGELIAEWLYDVLDYLRDSRDTRVVCVDIHR